MQRIRFGEARVREFVLDAVEEAAHATESATFRHARARTVRTDEIPRTTDALDVPCIALSPRIP